MKTTIAAAGLLLGSSTAFGAVVTPGNLTFSENFNSYAGEGFSLTPTAVQLSTDTYAMDGFNGGTGPDGIVSFGASAGTGNYGRGINTGDGTNTTSGVYAFTLATSPSTDRALGVLPAAVNFNPGSFYINIQNQTGGVLTGFDLDYDVFVWDRADRSSSLDFSYAVASVTTTAVSGTDPRTLSYTSVPSADFDSPLTTSDGFSGQLSLTPRSLSVTGLSVADGQSVVLRWTSADVGGSESARDAVGLDNISFTAVPIPEPSSLMLLSGAGLLALRRR